MRANNAHLFFDGMSGKIPEKLKILAPRSEDFRNLRTRFYLLLCSLTPQQAAGNARAIVFIDKLYSYPIKDKILK